MGILRLLLALSVVATHCGAIWKFNLVGGQVAVQSFYIISGFYMSLILNEKYIGQNNSYKLFISNRFLRLYPIYWVVLLGTLLACVAAAILTKGHSYGKFDSYLLVKPNILSFAYLAVTNIIIFGQDVVMFLGITPENGNLFFTSNFWNTKPPLHSFLFVPQAWTLGLELTFYLLAPYIVRRGHTFVAALIVLSFLLRLFIYNKLGLQNDPWTYRFFPTEIMFFLLGYVSYQIHLNVKNRIISKNTSLMMLAFMILFTVAYPFIPDAKAGWLPFTWKELCYFSSAVLLIPFLFNFFKRNKLDYKIGELSYPVYISHMLVFSVCAGLPFAFLKSGTSIALLTIMFSYLLNRFIASPLEKYRQSRLSH